MHVKVNFLDKLRLEARFEDYVITSDQPIRYKGDATAPGPFDYFLASSAMCAAYFVKVYCQTRNIPTKDISITQDNIIDPENRYKQKLVITAHLPDSLSEKDKKGIINSMERCSVKRVIQNSPEFEVKFSQLSENISGVDYKFTSSKNCKTIIHGKDASLEESLEQMTALIKELGIKIEISSWRNLVPHVWSVTVKDSDSPMCFANGKGNTKDAALCSALGEFIERLNNNYFYNDYYLGEDLSQADFIHYPCEKWFKAGPNDSLHPEIMDEHLLSTYTSNEPLLSSHLIDTNSGNAARGVCTLPFVRQSDKQIVYIPVNLIGNLFVSNGMSSGNTKHEAYVQSLSEIFERAIKNKIITEEICLPDIPPTQLSHFPNILEGVQKLEDQGFSIFVKDASLGGVFPVVCVTLMNPISGGVFASFGSHPNFEIALERSLTELLQGRSFQGLNDTPEPTFNSFAVTEPNNTVEHFIDSTGIISWKFFSDQTDYQYSKWGFKGSTKEEFDYLMDILKQLNKESYIIEFNELGSHTCRILVPDFSEIYPTEDLIWDNNNKGLTFRSRILNIHRLSQSELTQLVDELENSQLDNYMPIGDLIGVAFDDNSAWEKLTIGELKSLIYLNTNKLTDAKDLIEDFLQYNDNTPERNKFYKTLNTVLDVSLNTKLNIEDYTSSFIKMFGKELYEASINTLSGEIKFYGLTPTDKNLTGIQKHLRLIESYKKIHNIRKNFRGH